MSGLWNDFNDAQSNTAVIPKGTLARVRLTLRPGGFDDPSQGWTGGYAKRGTTGAVYLDAEYTVLEGPYARRKVWSMIGLYSPKGPDWANMGRSLVRGILNSARGISDSRRNRYPLANETPTKANPMARCAPSAASMPKSGNTASCVAMART